jgi:hypothetical protein
MGKVWILLCVDIPLANYDRPQRGVFNDICSSKKPWLTVCQRWTGSARHSIGHLRELAGR